MQVVGLAAKGEYANAAATYEYVNVFCYVHNFCHHSFLQFSFIAVLPGHAS